MRGVEPTRVSDRHRHWLWLSYEVTRNRVPHARQGTPGYVRTSRLESSRTKIRDSAQQRLILFGERILDIAVDIYLTEELHTAANKHDDLCTSLDAASQVIV